jgi:hypothetical protein
VLDVVADVVVHFADWRSRSEPNVPVAARTTAGTATRTTSPASARRSLCMAAGNYRA